MNIYECENDECFHYWFGKRIKNCPKCYNEYVSQLIFFSSYEAELNKRIKINDLNRLKNLDANSQRNEQEKKDE